MSEKQTARKKLPYPTSTPGKVSNGAIDIEELARAEDEVNEGHQDFLQAGVVASTDWSLTANINSGTGALGSTGNTGGTAWLPDPVVSGALMRSITSSATLSGIVPSLLPASGKYVSCAFELTPSTWGAAATVTAHSGTEKNTEAEAIAAPPATTAGKMQVREVIIHNVAGVYSIVAQRDRRPWAAGAYANVIGTAHFFIELEGLSKVLTEMSLRIECSGRPVRLRLSCNAEADPVETNEVFIGAGFQMDGKVLSVTPANELCRLKLVTRNNSLFGRIDMLYDFIPPAGSHLFQATARKSGPGGTLGKARLEASPESPMIFSIEELRPTANNGTS